MTEGPYKLPKGWRWVRLGDVCQVNPRRPRLNRSGDTPTTFIPMSAIDEITGTISASRTRPYDEVRKGYTYFQEGDVLFAKITPCMENGKAAIARGLLDGIGFGSTEFHVLRPKAEVLAEWIWMFVRQKHFRMAAKASFRGGVGQQRVPQDFLESHLIPLPPLDEQRRITIRVEQLTKRVMEARRLREAAKEDAEHLMRSTLAGVFPAPGTELPTDWRWVKLGEVARVFSGSTAPQGRHYFQNGKWPFVRVQDLGRHRWTSKLVDTVDWVNELAVRDCGLKLAKAGTILFPKSGAAIYTNSRAVLGIDAYIVSHLAAIEVLPHYLDPMWAYYWLCSVDMTTLVDNPSYPSLRLSKVKELFLPLPPLSEQRRILAYLQAVDEKVNSLRKFHSATATELDRLEQAVLDKAFHGEL